MKKRDFIKRLFSIVPGIAIAKNILPNEKEKKIYIDENKDDKLITIDGKTFRSFSCSGAAYLFLSIVF